VIVCNLVRGNHDFRAYLELPILADALEESGCEDGRILRHLRATKKGHDARCWVVNGLLGCGACAKGAKASQRSLIFKQRFDVRN
jgi:hypothetical protein